MRIFLSVLGWTLLALLVLLVLVLVLPARAVIEYREGALTVKLQVLGIRFPVYPFSEKTNFSGMLEKLKKIRLPWRKRKKKSAERTGEKKQKPKLAWEDIQGMLGMAGAFTQRMLRSIHVTDIILIVPVHRDDAAQTAVSCGKAEAWLSGAAAFLQNFLDLRFIQVRVLPDFTGEITAGVYLFCKVGARPIAILAAGIHAMLYLFQKDEPPAAPPVRAKAAAPKGRQ